MDKSIFPYPLIESPKPASAKRSWGPPGSPGSQLEKHLQDLLKATEAGNYNTAPGTQAPAPLREDFMQESHDDSCTSPDEG